MASSNEGTNANTINKNKEDQNYKIKKGDIILGKGAFGTVFLGVKENPNGKIEKIALKEIPKELGNEESQKALDNEIAICEKLDNTNIVKMIKIEKNIGDKNYLVYELCNGGDLRRYMDYFKTFDEELIQYIVIKMCNALFELHRKNVVHHDIKPENILIQLFPDEEITPDKEQFIDEIKKATSKDKTQNNSQVNNNSQYPTNYYSYNQFSTPCPNNNFINHNMMMNQMAYNQPPNYNIPRIPSNTVHNNTMPPMNYIQNNNFIPNYLCGNNNSIANNNIYSNNYLSLNCNNYNMQNNNNIQYNNNLNAMNFNTFNCPNRNLNFKNANNYNNNTYNNNNNNYNNNNNINNNININISNTYNFFSPQNYMMDQQFISNNNFTFDDNNNINNNVGLEEMEDKNQNDMLKEWENAYK
jgi:serine/threonine protein kinase